MSTRVAVLSIILALAVRSPAASQPALYSAVEADKFVAARGIAFPSDYQTALREDIAREMSIAYPTIVILRPGDTPPTGRAVLRISGTVTRFKPGNRAKKFIIGFGAGATVVQAVVRLADASTARTIVNRQLDGFTWIGAGGGDSENAADSLAKKIVKLCNAAHLIASY
jgi:hypothetical protein